MRTLRLLPLLLLAWPISGQDDPMARYGWLRELCGACWTANLPDGATTDTQCYEERLGRFIFGSIRIGAAAKVEAGAKPTVHAAGFAGEGLFAWDAKLSGVAFYFWASNGDHGRSEVVFDGEHIRFPQAARPGSPETRSSWTRLGPDSFRVAREQKLEGAWAEKFSVTYKRTAESR